MLQFIARKKFTFIFVLSLPCLPTRVSAKASLGCIFPIIVDGDISKYFA